MVLKHFVCVVVEHRITLSCISHQSANESYPLDRIIKITTYHKQTRSVFYYLSWDLNYVERSSCCNHKKVTVPSVSVHKKQK